MKNHLKNYLILLTFILCSASAFSQYVPVPRGNANQLDQSRGAVQGIRGFILPVLDTTNNPGTPYLGALTVLPSDAGLASIPIYMSNGIYWTRFIGGTGTNVNDTIWTRIPIAVDTTSIPGRRILFLLHADGLISGGIVTKADCWKIGVTSAIYSLGYRQYTSATSVLDIDTADATFGRIDRVVVDTFGIVSVLTGTPSSTPLPPTMNHTSQWELTQISVPAGSTCLAIPIEIVYDEGLGNPSEWDSFAATATADNLNTDNPFHLTTAVFVSTYTDGSYISFSIPPNVKDTVHLGEIFKFFVYFNGLFSNQFQIQFYNGTTPVGNTIAFNTGYGLNPADSNAYQQVSIPLYDFGLIPGQLHDKIQFTMAGNDTSGAKGFFLDYLQLQTGINNFSFGKEVLNYTKNYPTNDSTVLTLRDGTRFAAIDNNTGGGGGGGEAIDLTLRIGNTTKQTYRVVDSLATASGGGLPSPFTLWPQNYLTAYGGIKGTQGAFSHGGYGYYPLVNSDGRPNVVYDLFDYNGGFGSPTIAGEVSAAMRFESHFNSGGRTLIESHGFFPEIVPRSGQIIRLGSTYSDDSTGVSNTVFHIDGVGFFQGNTDTIMLNLDPGNITFGLNNNGHFIYKNQRIPTNSYDVLIGSGVTFSIGGGVTPSTSYFNWTSPGIFSTSPTIGTSASTAIKAKVGIAGASGFTLEQVGLTSSNITGMYGDMNTSGILSVLDVRNTGTGTIQAVLKSTSTGKIQYTLYDVSNNNNWNFALKGGETEGSLRIGVTNDSALLIRGNTGYGKFKYKLAVGTAEPTARLMLPAGTTSVATAPLKFTTASAALLTTPEAGAMEVLVDSLYYTGSSGTRYKIYPGSGGGGGGNNIYNIDSSLSSNRIVDLNGKTLRFQENGNDLISFDPVTFVSEFNQQDGIDANVGLSIIGDGGGNDVQFVLKADNNIAGKDVRITGDGISGTIGYEAETQTFTGDAAVFTLTNSFGIVATNGSNVAGLFTGASGSGWSNQLSGGDGATNYTIENSINGNKVEVQNTAFDGVSQALKVHKNLTTLVDPPAAGIGESIDFYIIKNTINPSNNIASISNQIISKWTNADSATITSEFSITGVDNNATNILFTLSGNGAAKLNQYGNGTFTGTAAYNLQVDASGNLIETAAAELQDLQSVTDIGNTTNQSITSSVSIKAEGSTGTPFIWASDENSSNTIGLFAPTSDGRVQLAFAVNSFGGRLYSDNITADREWQLPDASGTLALFGGTARLLGYTVATLPAGTQGDIAFVTDALLPSFLTTVVGGGAVVTPVFFDGSTWKSY